MSRRRNAENRGLPTRWKFQHGAYYYQVPKKLEPLWDGKQLFRLGSSLSAAYKLWADRVAAPERVQTVGQLLDRYLLEVVPTKRPTTQTGNKIQIAAVRGVFGNLPIESIMPKDVYRYVDKRTHKVAAHREKAVLSHALTKAVEWGLIDKNPLIGQVRLKGEKARTRYVEDWEVLAVLAMKPFNKKGGVLMIQSYIRVKLLTGLRRGDLLRLRVSGDLDEVGINVTPSKTSASTGKRRVFSWSTELRDAVDLAKAARPVDIAPWLFCTKAGECYIGEDGSASGWDSMWQRFMTRVLKETKVTERFTEHDLRGKVGSDEDSTERARQLLGHASAATTERAYRRKVEVIRPVR